MKHIALFAFLGLLVGTIFAQVSCVYSIEAPVTFQQGFPQKVTVEMRVSVDQGHWLLEVKRTDGSSQKPSCTLIDMQNKLIYGFEDSLSVAEYYTLQTDTLIYTGKKVTYNKYNCEIYSIKNKPGIKIYCSKELDSVINPGISFFYKKSVGGVARIEIARKESTIVYQLISIDNKKTSALNAYIDITRNYAGKLMGKRSILGD